MEGEREEGSERQVRMHFLQSSHRLIANFSLAKTETKRISKDFINALKEKNCKPKVLYGMKTCIRMKIK